MHRDFDDAVLEEELRRIASHLDPVPPDAVERAIDGFTWRTIGADLAELAFDSLADMDAGGALVRGAWEPRSLTFRAGDLSIELEVSGTRGSFSLIGQLVPAQAATLQVRHKAGVVTIEADELGRFSTQQVPAGPLSLRCLPGPGAARPTVITDWISI